MPDIPAPRRPRRRGEAGSGSGQGAGERACTERSETNPKLHTHPALLSPHHYARDWACGGKHMPARALRAVQTARFCCDLPSARALPAGRRGWCFIHLNLFPLPPGPGGDLGCLPLRRRADGCEPGGCARAQRSRTTRCTQRGPRQNPNDRAETPEFCHVFFSGRRG